MWYETYPRACLKKAFCKMCVTICGIFCPDEGAVAGYGNWIRVKYPAKWGVQIAGMIFQTRSSIKGPYIIISYRTRKMRIRIWEVATTTHNIHTKFSLRCELKTLSSHDWSRVLPDALGVRLNIGGYACNLGAQLCAFPMPDMAGSHIPGSPLYICLYLCCF